MELFVGSSLGKKILKKVLADCSITILHDTCSEIQDDKSTSY